VNAAIHDNGLVDVDQSALNCTSCHGTSTRVGITGADPRQISAPPLGTHGETASTTLAVGAHLPHLNQATYADTPIMCNDCHAVPTSNLHSDGIVQVTFGALAKTGGAAPSWSGTTCSGVYCHGAFPGGSTTFQPNWTAGTVTCGSCHTTPPSSGHHGKHTDLECGDCHGAGYAYLSTTTVNPTLHLNGVTDTAGPKITSYNATTKSCTTASACHNSAMTW
jgi:predicted CxxxxCH...CXXCH cytochrome family protein